MNSIKKINRSNFIKSKLEQLSKSNESLNKSKILLKEKNMNLKNIFYYMNTNNSNNKHNLYSPKKSQIFYNKNINSDDSEEDLA